MFSEKARAVNPSPTILIDSKAKEMKAQGIDIIGFGAGEPDFETPRHIKEAGIKAINDGDTRYTPAAGTLELKEAICHKLASDNNLNYEPGQIVVSNGAKHSLNNALNALLNCGDEVIIPSPYWVSYPELVKLHGGAPVFIETSAKTFFKIDNTDLKKAYSNKSKALILNSPSNPTGQIYTKNELKDIAQFCYDHNLIIIADDIYEKLIYGNNSHTSIAEIDKTIQDITILVNGVSKSYAMTGWRIGYTASTAKIASVMANIQGHTTSNPNTIAQKAAVAALLGPQNCVEEMLSAFNERKKYMHNRVTEINGLNALEPMGAFYLFINLRDIIGKSYQGTPIENGDVFSTLLLEHFQVAVVPGSGFGADEYIRLSFATSQENIVEGLNRLESFVALIN